MPAKYTNEVRLLLTDAQDRDLEGYAEENLRTKSDAARFLMVLQLRHVAWTKRREAKGVNDKELDRLAQAILRDHPGWSEKRLKLALAERAGRWIDMEKVKSAAARNAPRDGGSG